VQALFMINSPLLAEQSAAFADRIAAQPVARQTDFAWMAALGRPPTARERELTAKFVQTSGSRSRALAALAQSLFCTAEFSTID
jgi:hypothetical protein